MLIRKLLSSRHGNFAITSAILLPILIGALGLNFDYLSLVTKRRLVQTSLDSASLASAAAMAAQTKTTTTAKTYALDFLSAELQGRLPSSDISALVANTTVSAVQTTAGTTKSYTVSMKGTLPVKLTPFSKFLGVTTSSVTAASNTTSVIVARALSVYLVVDRSGSMSWVTSTKLSSPASCQNYTEANWAFYPYLSQTSPCYLNKIGSLKNAAASLFDELDALEAQNTNDTILRTGVVSFTDSQQTPSNLAWGTTAGRNYVTALPSYPTGGTDMTNAMYTAYQALIASSETTAQASKGNTSVSKFIILMTDGENTGASSTWNPALDTETLQTCTEARNAGITIFTVAYMAPANGKTLLQNCAGTSTNAFQAENAGDLDAAFAEIGKKISERATRITS
jgi:Flp pilus assembly protein TadG